MKTIYRENVTSIENNTEYNSCVFMLDERMQVLENCRFHNCSFRSRRIYFWKMTNCIFTNCSFHKIIISIIKSCYFENEYIHILDLSSKKINTEDIDFLIHLKNINIIYMYETDITSDKLRYLAHLTKLQQLYLYNTPIDNLGLKHIQHLNIKILDISRTKVDNDGISYLVQMKQLKKLYTYNTPIHYAKKKLANVDVLGSVESMHQLFKAWQEK